MKRMLLTLVCCGWTPGIVTAQPKPERLKVHISVDMEGLTGVVSPDQLSPAGFEYERFREFMTQEALAAVEGARAAGATEILVGDAHGNGQNLLIERFPADIRIVRAWPRPLGMMQGIDSTFDAAVFIGYHASGNASAGIRAHTRSRLFVSIDFNGVSQPESGINAAIAGHYGVPVVFISGDRTATTEFQRFVPNVGTAVVKDAITLGSGTTLTPQAGQALIRQGVRAALLRRREIAPLRVSPPVRLDLTLRNVRPIELLGMLRFVQRTGTRTVRYTGDDVLEISGFLEFIHNFQLQLEP